MGADATAGPPPERRLQRPGALDKPPVPDLLAIGNALVDVLAHEDDSFLDRHDLAKGSMALVDDARAEQLYADMAPAVEVSGGMAANTAAGLASLGGRAAFIGKVRDDQL